MTINDLLPGPFDTDRLRGTMKTRAAKAGRSFEEEYAAGAKAHPAGRFGTAEEFGAMCAFLCSVHASYMTGQNILMDGGQYPAPTDETMECVRSGAGGVVRRRRARSPHRSMANGSCKTVKAWWNSHHAPIRRMAHCAAVSSGCVMRAIPMAAGPLR